MSMGSEMEGGLGGRVLVELIYQHISFPHDMLLLCIGPVGTGCVMIVVLSKTRLELMG